MNKNNKTVTIIVILFMIINTYLIVSLNKQINQLKGDINRISSDLNHEIRSTNQNTYNLKDELLSKIEKGESLLASYEIETQFKSNQFEVTIEVIPKEKYNDEKIYLSIDDEKKEAVSNNDSSYAATFVLKRPQRSIPTVSFESPNSIRQETLPEINLDGLLSLGYKSHWEKQDGEESILLLIVYVKDERASSLLSGTPKAEVIIRDNNTGTEVGRKEMQLKENLNSTYFSVDLKEFLNMKGSYDIWQELETENGILYSESIASFDNKGKTNVLGSGSGALFPTW